MVKWTYEIRYGPEGEDIYAWVRDDRGDLVCNAKTYHAIAIVEAANAAKLREGAEPVAWLARAHDGPPFHGELDVVSPDFDKPAHWSAPFPVYLHPTEQTNARSGVSDWIFYNPDHHDQPPSQDTIVEGFCMITGSWGEPCAAVHVPWKGVNRVVVYRILSALSPAAPEGRFDKLSPDAPAAIREDADTHLACLSTAELVSAPDPTPVDDDISRVYEDHEPAAPEDLPAEAAGPVPVYECEFRIGQPVQIAKPEPGEDPDAIYYVTGIEWEHRTVPRHGWNITIASREDIERGHGQTDGYAPSDLVPALAQEGK